MDPYQINHMSGAIAGMMGFFVLFGLAITAFSVFLFWRILTKAGLSGPLSLLVLRASSPPWRLPARSPWLGTAKANT